MAKQGCRHQATLLGGTWFGAQRREDVDRVPLDERLLGQKGAGSQAAALQPGKSDKQKGKGFQKTGEGRWGAAKLGSLPNDASQGWEPLAPMLLRSKERGRETGKPLCSEQPGMSLREGSPRSKVQNPGLGGAGRGW